MSPVGQFFVLVLNVIVAAWFLSWPGFVLLAWARARLPEDATPEHRARLNRCYWLLAISPLSLAFGVAFPHEGPVLEWPNWVDFFVPTVLAINALLGGVLLWRAQGVRFAATLVVIATLLLSLASAVIGNMVLTGVGP